MNTDFKIMTFSVAFVFLFVAFTIGMLIGRNEGKESVRLEAIIHKSATYITSPEGKPQFKWLNN